MIVNSLEHTLSKLERQASEADATEKKRVAERLKRLISSVEPKPKCRVFFPDDDDLLFDNVPV